MSSMKLGLVLALVSALQIGQQSIISELSENLSEKETAIVGAAFPAGKFLSTILLAITPAEARFALILDAWFLVLGAVISLIPHIIFLTIGRFLIGCGAGIGFVCATVMLFERIPYAKRPAHFCILGLAFAFATFIINILPVLDLTYTWIICLASAFSGVSGILYIFWGTDEFQPNVDKEAQELTLKISSFPSTLVYALMVLNVSIGVPVVLGFSAKIFSNFGAEEQEATVLSMVFPVLQMSIMLFLYFNRIGVNRRLLVIGGYVAAVLVQFLLLVTSVYPFLPPKHHTYAMCILFLLLAVVSSVPANTALCLIAEQFSDLREQTRNVGKGRAVMWCLATLSTASFMACLHKYGFTITFLPYFVVSCGALFLIVKIFPNQEE